MIPSKDQYVRIIFKNSTHAEGFVESWSGREAVLRSADGTSLLIIQDVAADIMAVKVYFDPPEKQSKIEEEIERKQEIEQDFEEVHKEPEIDQYAKARTLLELRKLQAEQDRKIVSEKLKDHTATQTNVTVPKYELPGFFKKQSAK